MIEETPGRITSHVNVARCHPKKLTICECVILSPFLWLTLLSFAAFSATSSFFVVAVGRPYRTPPSPPYFTLLKLISSSRPLPPFVQSHTNQTLTIPSLSLRWRYWALNIFAIQKSLVWWISCKTVVKFFQHLIFKLWSGQAVLPNSTLAFSSPPLIVIAKNSFSDLQVM